MNFPTDRTTFDGPVVDHWLEWKRAQTANASTVQDQSAIGGSKPLQLSALSTELLPAPTLAWNARDVSSIPNVGAIFLFS